MTYTYKPKTLFQIDVIQWGTRDEETRTVLEPQLIDVRWTRNNHLEADELVATVSWKDAAAIDPRLLKNARGAFWLWDANREDFDKEKHLRFTGICKKVQRKLTDGGWAVECTFHDFTSLFINNKPLKSSGMPEYSDTLKAIWERICDNTGAEDPDSRRIISSVEALRPNLRFMRADMATHTLGEIVPKRFHAVSKPTPKNGASSWDVWQWCIGALGLISYIDKDECIITDTTEHYSKENAPIAVYGENIHSLEEEVDTEISMKGILLKSYDPLSKRILEAFYPLPGDDRLKAHRRAFGKKSEAGALVTENEQSGDYEEFNMYSITNQTDLDRVAKEAYEERSRQEVQGTFRTAEMVLYNKNSFEPIDIFSLRAGDPIIITLNDESIRKDLLGLDSEADRIRYLVDRQGYDEDVAKLLVRNFDADEIASQVFHVREVELNMGADHFEAEVKFHNLITVG